MLKKKKTYLMFFGFFLHSCVDSLQLHKGFDPHCVNLTPRKASKA